MRFLQDLAEKHEIKWQPEILPRGATDSAALQKARSGIPVGIISIPTRYVHSSIETIRKSDLKGAVDLLAAFIEEGHTADLNLQ